MIGWVRCAGANSGQALGVQFEVTAAEHCILCVLVPMHGSTQNFTSAA